MDKMLELDKRIHLVARLPPTEDLVTAFNAFVSSRNKRQRPIEDFHAVRLLQTLQTIEKHPGGSNELADTSLFMSHLRMALSIMKKYPKRLTRSHNALARLIYRALESRSSPVDNPEDTNRADRILRDYISILCGTGDAQDALTEWTHKKKTDEKNVVGWTQSKKNVTGWTELLHGFAMENNEEMMLRVIELAKAESPKLDPPIHLVMTMFYARNNNVAATKEWFKSSIFNPKPVELAAQWLESPYKTILEFCIRNNEMEWGQSVLQSSAAKSQEQHTWDAIFHAAAATGKSVDDIDKMISVMVQQLETAGKDARPDVETINGLIDFSLSRKDAYTAERYFSLLEKWKVEPNARSFILQVQYRMAAGDISGALRSYDRLRDEKIENDEDWEVMNNLLLAVLNQESIPNETIIGLVEDISDRRRVFLADTVIALCTYHLKRDEYLELVDLLQTYSYQYSIAERIRIRDHLVNFTVDPATDTGRAWDTYMIFHQIFDIETRRNIRNNVIFSFFDRKRPDLATHVFTRMSRHVRADTRPDEETYVRMFEGIAKTADTEALEVVHNLLKLDTETDPTTRILNGLMMAYTKCDAPRRALEFWDQISRSDEGPSYNSLHIAFRACEKAPWGHRTAKKIWEKLLQSDIVIEKDLFASYVGALSGQSLIDEVIETADKMEEVVGEGLDVNT